MEQKICKLCGKPFETYIELGKDNFPIWIHNYPTLNDCKNICQPIDFAKLILKKDELMKKWLEKYNGINQNP